MNNTYKLFKLVRELEGKRFISILGMKDSQGNLNMKK